MAVKASKTKTEGIGIIRGKKCKKTKDDGAYPFGWRWHKGREIL